MGAGRRDKKIKAAQCARCLNWDPHQNKKNMASGGLTPSEIHIMNKRDGSRKGL
jgi:hypothetical protein